MRAPPGVGDGHGRVLAQQRDELVVYPQLEPLHVDPVHEELVARRREAGEARPVDDQVAELLPAVGDDAVAPVRPLAAAQVEHEAFRPDRYAADLLISGMRGIEGVEVARLQAVGLLPAQDMVHRLVSAGLIRLTPHRIALNPDAFPVSDSVVRALVESLEPV